MVNIRMAAPGDEDRLLELASLMHKESPRYRGLPFSHTRTRGLIEYLMTSDDACIIVAEDGGVIFGMFGAVAVSHFFCDERYAIDMAFYITPDRRGAIVAAKMVAAYEVWATNHGIRPGEVMLGVSSGIDPDRTVKLYERLGYRISSTTLIKDI